MCYFIYPQGVNWLVLGRSLKYFLTCNNDALPEVISSVLGLADGEALWQVGL